MHSNVQVDRLMELHDDDPIAVGRQLRHVNLALVEPADRERLGWLINHVIGDKEQCWAEALALQLGMPEEGLTASALCCRAVAATLAGDVLAGCAAERAIGRASGASYSEIAMAVRLETLEHIARGSDPVAIAAALSSCVAEMRQWVSPGPLDRMFAVSLNNVVSALLEVPGAPSTESIYGEALTEGAALCRMLWRRVGTWINQERAEYLVALCHNHVGDWQPARAAASAGLAIIDDNGSEDVDRAFLLLELARALRAVGELEAALAARAEAHALADAFSEPGLRAWFDSRTML